MIRKLFIVYDDIDKRHTYCFILDKDENVFITLQNGIIIFETPFKGIVFSCQQERFVSMHLLYNGCEIEDN